MRKKKKKLGQKIMTGFQKFKGKLHWEAKTQKKGSTSKKWILVFEIDTCYFFNS